MRTKGLNFLTMICFTSALLLALKSYPIEAKNTKSFKSITVTTLKSKCDCAKAFSIGLLENLKKKSSSTKTKLTDNINTKVAWNTKMAELGAYCMVQQKYSYQEISKCPSMVDAQKKLDQINLSLN